MGEYPESELVGDLCAALYGLGEYATLQEAAEKTVGFTGTVQPDGRNEAVYDDLFAVYRSLYGDTKNSMHTLSELQNKEETT